MGIWYSAPIDNQKGLALFESVPVPFKSSRYISLDKTEGKLGLLSLPNTLAFLYPSGNTQQFDIAVDGRIHNKQKLCHMLHLNDNENLGRIITLLYEKYGPEGLYRLDGAFSLILVDTQKQMALLYRSFLTGFPLYYTAKNNLLSVSTNPLDILHRHDTIDSLNMEQMSGFFSLDLHSWTDSIFSDVDEVAYGEMIMISAKGTQSKKRALNKVLLPQNYSSESEIIQQYRHLLNASIEKNIVPDKKYGIMLSSGMDSSTMAALVSRYLKEQGRELRAYSWTLPSYKKGDETEKIKELCTALNIELTLFNGEDFSPFSNLDNLKLVPDVPFYKLYYSMISELYKTASEDGVNALLGGYYGDAIFPSRHTIFTDIARDRRFELLLPEWNSMVKDVGYINTIKKIPPLRALARFLLPFRNRPAYSAPEWLSAKAKESRENVRRNNKYDGEQAYKQFSFALSKTTISSGIGRYVTEEFGIENVTPFIDLALINHTLNLPAYMAYREGQKKYLAREAMRGLLPESIRTQVKHGVGNLGEFAYESFMQNKREVRERLFDERDPWKVYVNEKWMETRFKKNAVIKDQDLIVIWMSLHMAPWQRAIKPGGSLYGQ